MEAASPSVAWLGRSVGEKALKIMDFTHSDPLKTSENHCTVDHFDMFFHIASISYSISIFCWL